MEIIEYCNNSISPLDCVIAKFRNSAYPHKVNHGFHEAFFILEGECYVETVSSPPRTFAFQFGIEQSFISSCAHKSFPAGAAQ